MSIKRRKEFREPTIKEQMEQRWETDKVANALGKAKWAVVDNKLVQK